MGQYAPFPLGKRLLVKRVYLLEYISIDVWNQTDCTLCTASFYNNEVKSLVPKSLDTKLRGAS